MTASRHWQESNKNVQPMVWLCAILCNAHYTGLSRSQRVAAVVETTYICCTMVHGYISKQNSSSCFCFKFAHWHITRLWHGSKHSRNKGKEPSGQVEDTGHNVTELRLRLLFGVVWSPQSINSWQQIKYRSRTGQSIIFTLLANDVIII